jgi:transcriptional regulator with XRE-family HTH domain
MAIMISSNLRMLRRSSRYTLEELAEIIGVSRQTIAKWEAGETYPDIENCVKLSALFKVSLDALVKEPIQYLVDKPNDQGQYMFGIEIINDDGSVPLTDKARTIMGIFPGDRILLLGDRDKGIAIVKCDGINDYLDMEESK